MNVPLMPHITLSTSSLHETKALAAALGRALRGGEVLELLSDLGGGKTTFVKGLAEGLDIHDTVQSPTFTISRVYHARDKLELHHFDFYRLHAAGVMAAELAESLNDPAIIVAVEWADVVRHVLPDEHITIQLRAKDETTRELDFIVPQAYDYLSKALEAALTKRGAKGHDSHHTH